MPESIPEDKCHAFACPDFNCIGTVVETEKGIWNCDTCDFHFEEIKSEQS